MSSKARSCEATTASNGYASIRKAARVASLAKRLGLLASLERTPRRPGLIVINYHRIADRQELVGDRDVVSATPDMFWHQISWLRRNFHIATLEEAQDFVDHPARFRHPVFLITFDDGYRDNYDIAFPILKSLSVPATFFLVTDLVGTATLPWWDRIAELVRKRRHQAICLDYPWPVRIEGDTARMIRAVLQLYKDPNVTDSALFFSGLATACAAPQSSEPTDRLFMDWNEARQMLTAGMSFGSHTHTHELLARQSEADQLMELTMSRTLIRSNLGIRCDAFAYPVGLPTSYSQTTIRALEEAGYRTAFTFYGGINRPTRTEWWNVRRITPADDLGFDGYRLRALLSATLGQAWP